MPQQDRATWLGKKLARGDYLRLLSNNICTMEAIESAEEKKGCETGYVART